MVLHYTLWGWHIFLYFLRWPYSYCNVTVQITQNTALRFYRQTKYNIQKKTLHWYNCGIEKKMMYLTPILLTVFLCPTVVKFQNSFLTYINKFLILNPTSKRKAKKKFNVFIFCVLRVCDEVNITKHAFGRLLLNPVLFCSTIYTYFFVLYIKEWTKKPDSVVVALQSYFISYTL